LTGSLILSFLFLSLFSQLPNDKEMEVGSREETRGREKGMGVWGLEVVTSLLPFPHPFQIPFGIEFMFQRKTN
jgi:hypothetical protein